MLLRKLESKERKCEDRKADLSDWPAIDKAVSRFNDSDRWALWRILFSLKENVEALQSDNEARALFALEDILIHLKDMESVKKRLRRNNLGNRSWM